MNSVEFTFKYHAKNTILRAENYDKINIAFFKVLCSSLMKVQTGTEICS